MTDEMNRMKKCMHIHFIHRADSLLSAAADPGSLLFTKLGSLYTYIIMHIYFQFTTACLTAIEREPTLKTIYYAHCVVSCYKMKEIQCASNHQSTGKQVGRIRIRLS